MIAAVRVVHAVADKQEDDLLGVAAEAEVSGPPGGDQG